MGILNVTPDSFSDGGAFATTQAALAQARRMVGDGADIIDVGGESTRPNASPVSAQEEQDRILPVIEAIAREGNTLISVDTYREGTARVAIAAGAHAINDVWGLRRDPGLAGLAAETGAGLILMHTGRERTKDPDVVADQFAFLQGALDTARGAGVRDDQILLDPGFGFAKDTEENLQLLARFERLQKFGIPLVVGTSRKRFIGEVTGRADGQARAVGTSATSVILRLKGADLFRVHDVASNVDALAIADAVIARTRPPATRQA